MTRWNECGRVDSSQSPLTRVLEAYRAVSRLTHTDTTRVECRQRLLDVLPIDCDAEMRPFITLDSQSRGSASANSHTICEELQCDLSDCIYCTVSRDASQNALNGSNLWNIVFYRVTIKFGFIQYMYSAHVELKVDSIKIQYNFLKKLCIYSTEYSTLSAVLFIIVFLYHTPETQYCIPYSRNY